MKQTAVEWLIEQIFNEIDLKDSILKLAINQAKAMEKKQIIEAFEHIDYNLDDGLHYYEQNFKSE